MWARPLSHRRGQMSPTRGPVPSGKHSPVRVLACLIVLYEGQEEFGRGVVGLFVRAAFRFTKYSPEGKSAPGALCAR
jgi:hypothetical protein